jgi:hypothetical protein
VINVFKGAFDDDDWFFEVIDDQGNTEISDHMYRTDQAALEAAIPTFVCADCYCALRLPIFARRSRKTVKLLHRKREFSAPTSLMPTRWRWLSLGC